MLISNFQFSWVINFYELQEAEMFIFGSIMKMRRGDKDWEGDLEMTARKIKSISKGLECKIQKIKECYQKKTRPSKEKKNK